MPQENQTDVPGAFGVDEAKKEAYLCNYSTHRVGITAEEMTATYTDMAREGKYEQLLGEDTYRGPCIADSYVRKYIKDKDAKIIDIAAGTGNVGIKLQKFGYTCLDGMEPSEGMREIAVNRSIYRNMYPDYMSDKQTNISEGIYDAVVVAGAMGEGHIPCAALTEMARITAKGGHVIIVMREEYLTYVAEYVDRLEPYMKKIEQEGIWKQVERTTVENYSFDKNGVVFVFVKL